MCCFGGFGIKLKRISRLRTLFSTVISIRNIHFDVNLTTNIDKSE